MMAGSGQREGWTTHRKPAIRGLAEARFSNVSGRTACGRQGEFAELAQILTPRHLDAIGSLPARLRTHTAGQEQVFAKGSLRAARLGRRAPLKPVRCVQSQHLRRVFVLLRPEALAADEKLDVEVCVQHSRPVHSLTSGPRRSLPRLVEVARDHPEHYLQHRRYQLGCAASSRRSGAGQSAATAPGRTGT